jgi:hypothetical protein
MASSLKGGGGEGRVVFIFIFHCSLFLVIKVWDQFSFLNPNEFLMQSKGVYKKKEKMANIDSNKIHLVFLYSHFIVLQN